MLASDKPIDPDSFALGVIFAFCEVVAAGVKQLALSEPATPEQMQRILPEAQRIAKHLGVEVYLEADLIQTDLFPNLPQGHQVLLIYKGDVLGRYQAIKQEREHLTLGRAYMGPLRRKVAVAFGRLLSYSDAHIEASIARNTGP